MRADLLTLMPWAGSKVCIIHNFIEDELWGYSPYPTPPIAEPYIFIAAGFRPEKAFDILLPALKRVNCRRKLVIAGIGPDDAAFQNLRNSAGLSAEDVRCLGFVASPYHWIAHADLCVLPSRYEGFSNFLLEAGALGKRVVATSCPGGNAEFFEAYKNVIPVPVDDIAALATALEAPRADMDRLEARRRLVTFERETVLAEYMRALFHS
jgi:glycosyltransferase involved in cell wall biosynthesis